MANTAERHAVSLDEILSRELEDADFRAEWERLAPARAVAHWVIAYRAAHDLTQAQLAAQLGMHQPQIARLESGEHVPDLATLLRLAGGLGLSISVEITPPAPTVATAAPIGTKTEEVTTPDGARMRIAVA